MWYNNRNTHWTAHPSFVCKVVGRRKKDCLIGSSVVGSDGLDSSDAFSPSTRSALPKKRGDTHLSSFFLRLLKRTWGDCERLRKTANESRTICIITWAGVCGCSFAAPTYSLHQCCNCFLYERLSDCAAWIVYRCGASITRNKRREKKNGFLSWRVCIYRWIDWD